MTEVASASGAPAGAFLHGRARDAGRPPALLVAAGLSAAALVLLPITGVACTFVYPFAGLPGVWPNLVWMAAILRRISQLGRTYGPQLRECEEQVRGPAPRRHVAFYVKTLILLDCNIFAVAII